MNAISTSASSISPASVPLVASTLLVQLLAAMVLGSVVTYAVGFAPSPLAHNAAHDVRHIAGTPCH